MPLPNGSFSRAAGAQSQTAQHRLPASRPHDPLNPGSAEQSARASSPHPTSLIWPDVSVWPQQPGEGSFLLDPVPQVQRRRPRAWIFAIDSGCSQGPSRPDRNFQDPARHCLLAGTDRAAYARGISKMDMLGWQARWSVEANTRSQSRQQKLQGGRAGMSELESQNQDHISDHKSQDNPVIISNKVML